MKMACLLRIHLAKVCAHLWNNTLRFYLCNTWSLGEFPHQSLKTLVFSNVGAPFGFINLLTSQDLNLINKCFFHLQHTHISVCIRQYKAFSP